MDYLNKNGLQYFWNAIKEKFASKIPTKTATGSTIEITDASSNKAKGLRVYGDSKQETRSGKNLFNVDTITENTYLNYNGNSGASTVSNVSDFMPVEANKQYIFSFNYETLMAENERGVAFFDSDKIIDSSIPFSYSPTSKKFIYTASKNGYLRVTYDKNCTEIQFEEGNVRTTYEKYGVSPSINFPAEIQNVTSNIEVSTSNKNLLDISGVNSSIYGVNYIAEENGSLLMNGKKIGGNNSNFNKQTKIMLNSGSYVCSYEILSGSIKKDDVNVSIKMYLVNSVDNSSVMIGELGANNKYKFDITKDGIYYLRLGIYSDNVVFDNAKVIIQIEKSSVATSHIKHRGQNVTFPLAEGQKLYKDSYLAEDGIHHKRFQVILDGDETITKHTTYNTSNYSCFYYNMSKKVIKPSSQYGKAGVLCSHLEERSWISVYSEKKDEDGFAVSRDNDYTLFIKISNSIASTVEELKNWLSQNNMTFEFILQTEEVEAYTEEQKEAYNKLQQIETYRDVTHVNAMSEELEAIIEVEYYTEFVGDKGETGKDGTNGKDGKDGVNGTNATINGVETLTIQADNHIIATQSGNVLTLSLDVDLNEILARLTALENNKTSNIVLNDKL